MTKFSTIFPLVPFYLGYQAGERGNTVFID